MKKAVALLLCLVIVFSFPASALATEITSSQSAGSVSEKTEVVSMRDTYSKTYLLPDGSYQYVAYAEPIHYKDSTDTFVEINNEIKESETRAGYKYTNTSNSWNAFFAEKLNSDDAVLITDGEHTVSFSFPRQTGIGTATKSGTLSKLSSSKYYEKVAADNRTVVYQNVVANVDIVYTVQHSVLKEDIVLKSKDAPNSFKFRLNANGLTVAEKDGTIALFDSEGSEVFAFTPLYMEDSNGKRSENVQLTCESIKNGYEITISADTAFLNAADTVYPVIIDPSVMVTGLDVTFDTCVDQEYPTSNYYLSENLWTGGALGTNAMRTYIKFALPNGISASRVTSAYVYLLKKEHQTPTIRAYRVTSNWSSSSITWNSKPSFTSIYPSGVAVNTVGEWYGLDVTTMVKGWLDGSYSNYGMVLKEPSETSSSQKTKFYSSDAPSPNKPELVINYNAGPQKTYYYNIYRGTAVPNSASEILNYVNTASLAIQNMYNVSFINNMNVSTTALNQRAGCALPNNLICNSACGADNDCEAVHHKAGFHFLDCVNTTSSNKIISYVDFALCRYTSASGHGEIYGAAYIGGERMIVSLNSYNVQRTTCHELSHLIGARDKVCTSGQTCVMKYGSNVTDVWCTQCQNDIFNYLDSIS